jgi:hypothetical protein
MSLSKANRTYVIEFGVAMVAYVVVLLTSVWLLNRDPLSPWRLAIALAPVIPAIFALVAFVRFLGRMDELQRRIQFDAIALSFGATAILTFAYGFLEGVGFPHLSWIWILPLMVMLWGLGAAIASMRYR